MSGAPLRVHDLVRVDPRIAERWDAPPWVSASLARAPWIVVRRESAGDEIAAGVRGPSRGQRFATRIDARDVRDRLTPRELVARIDAGPPSNRRLVTAARLVRGAAAELGVAWGVAGAFGFELAARLPATHAGSDLDIIVDGDRAADGDVPPAFAALGAFAARCARIACETGVAVDADVLVGDAGIALAELISGAPRVLAKTPGGPRLLAHPYARVECR